jgi:branched-subunit amino acid transport protein
MTAWIAILLVSATTFLLRASFILFADPQRFPHAFRQALKFVAPAVLAAIVAPGLFIADGRLEAGLENPRWIAGAVAIAATILTRSAVAAIACGMGALWLLQWGLGRLA